ncbi:MAG TPA: cyclic nucleotide-binding domain-containing protein [Candidatus Dormibacteraeota bacterium]|jgi:CRP-like cAMP-binding protein|nr:cyclic nucleotide-binding domain-containing protein [Candidatus Dormibacteraeota bacterium]
MSTTLAVPLSRLDPSEVEALLAAGTKRTFRVDEVVLEQGVTDPTLYIVTNGVLHVRRQAEGRQVLLGRVEPGGFFGEISLFDPGPTTAAVVAASNGEMVQLSRAQLQDFAQRSPGIVVNVLVGLLEGMAQRLRRTDERLVEAIFWGGLMR